MGTAFGTSPLLQRPLCTACGWAHSVPPAPSCRWGIRLLLFLRTLHKHSLWQNLCFFFFLQMCGFWTERQSFRRIYRECLCICMKWSPALTEPSWLCSPLFQSATCRCHHLSNGKEWAGKRGSEKYSESIEMTQHWHSWLILCLQIFHHFDMQ